MGALLEKVRRHWETETCGTRYSHEPQSRKAFFDDLERARYAMEPYIKPIARFEESGGKRVLEIGVGAGTDFVQWCRAGAHPTGIDLTEAAIRLTRERLELEGFEEGRDFSLFCANAEKLPFENESFEFVYAWGVLHHSPNPEQGFSEAFRVLRKGGRLQAMVYHPCCWTALFLWVKYGLMRGRFWLGFSEVIARHLESPGTQAFTARQAMKMLERIGFVEIGFQRFLGPGDLLLIEPSRKHQGAFFRWAKTFYPGRLVRWLGDGLGINLVVTCRKPVMKHCAPVFAQTQTGLL